MHRPRVGHLCAPRMTNLILFLLPIKLCRGETSRQEKRGLPKAASSRFAHSRRSRRSSFAKSGITASGTYVRRWDEHMAPLRAFDQISVMKVYSTYRFPNINLGGQSAHCRGLNIKYLQQAHPIISLHRRRRQCPELINDSGLKI